MRTLIIAEIGPNHNGSLDLALELTERLAAVGVDAVKFQLGTPEEVYSLDAFKASYQVGHDNAEDLFEAARARQLSRDAHKQLARRCEELGVEYLCTAFDLGSLVFLDEELQIPRFKIASGEIFSLDLIGYMGLRNKPIILSTGMATYEEIGRSFGHLREAGATDVTILHCVSAYPAAASDLNLRCIPELQRRFGVPVGFSDHSLGNEAAIAAVAMGATVIEKHVTLDRSLPGPDHRASATVEDFEALVRSIRTVEQSLGTAEKTFSEAERDVARVARKSIVAKRDLQPGHLLSRGDFDYRRPGTGFLPVEQDTVLGRRLVRPVAANRVIRREDLEWN